MGSLSMAFILYWFKLNVYRHVTGLVDNISLRVKSELFRLCLKNLLFQNLIFEQKIVMYVGVVIFCKLTRVVK